MDCFYQRFVNEQRNSLTGIGRPQRAFCLALVYISLILEFQYSI